MLDNIRLNMLVYLTSYTGLVNWAKISKIESQKCQDYRDYIFEHELGLPNHDYLTCRTGELTINIIAYSY